MTKRAALYRRVSTADQHPETQLLDLREFAKQRGLEIVREYTDVISGAKSKRPGLDQLLADARRHRFDIVIVAAVQIKSGSSTLLRARSDAAHEAPSQARWVPTNLQRDWTPRRCAIGQEGILHQ